MILAIILICCIPLALIVLVFVAIGVAAVRVGRTGKAAYAELKPDIDRLQQSAAMLADRGQDLAVRGTKLTETWEEIGDSFKVMQESLDEVKKSPFLRIARFAGQFRSG